MEMSSRETHLYEEDKQVPPGNAGTEGEGDTGEHAERTKEHSSGQQAQVCLEHGTASHDIAHEEMWALARKGGTEPS